MIRLDASLTNRKNNLVRNNTGGRQNYDKDGIKGKWHDVRYV